MCMAICFCYDGVVFHTEEIVLNFVMEEIPKFVRPWLWLAT